MPPLAQAIEYYTYDDYKKWDGDWELIDGIPLAIKSPLIIHQSIKTNIVCELFKLVEMDKNFFVLASTDWKVNSNTVLRPDISLICDEQNESYITKSPLIVVEIISKSTAKRDEKYKFEIYKDERVPYYIIVYPNDLKAKIYKLQGNEYIKEGDFSLESYYFDDLSCKASINFSDVFEKFRK